MSFLFHPRSAAFYGHSPSLYYPGPTYLYNRPRDYNYGYFRRPSESLFFAPEPSRVFFDDVFAEDFFAPRPSPFFLLHNRGGQSLRTNPEEQVAQEKVDKMDITDSTKQGAKDENLSESKIEKKRSSSELSPWSEFGLGNFFNRDFALKDEQNFKVDENDQAVTVTSNWEGFDKSDLKVDFEDGSLVISGRSKVETKDEKSGAVSRSFKSVSRRIPLPDNINKEDIKAKYTDNTFTLTIEVPKVAKEIEEKKGESIPIS
jgi:HSP20 family molecular chaperone IbpA